MRACSFLFLLTMFAFAATAAASVRVFVTQRDQTLRFVIVETMRDLVHHRPATRRYEFTTPMDAVIRAADIRDYFARYEGADGIWETHREPIAGYIILSHNQHPKTVEFRFLERWDTHIVPMSINGSHPVGLLGR